MAPGLPVSRVTISRGESTTDERIEVRVLSFQILIAVLAGATATVALQRPNHFALPLFFLLLLTLFSGMLVASFHAFSDIEILRRRIVGLRRQLSDLVSVHGSDGAGADSPGDWGTAFSPEATGNPPSESHRARHRAGQFRIQPY